MREWAGVCFIAISRAAAPGGAGGFALGMRHRHRIAGA